MKTLHSQLTKVRSVIHTTSPLFQAACCANCSRPRTSPETIRQRKPAHTMYWCEYPLAYLMTARAKNSPATVGMITFPIQDARLVMPFRNIEECLHHGLHELPQARNGQEAAGRADQPHGGLAEREVQNCSDDCEYCRDRQDLAGHVRPQSSQNICRREFCVRV